MKKMRFTCLVCGRKWVGNLTLIAGFNGCTLHHRKPCPDCGQGEIKMEAYTKERLS